MPDVRWTDAQLKAINTTDRSLLVSAAAGSGKTATLTERIIRSITERGTNISEMLIVTFTRAAVSELRARISRALESAAAENPELRRQLYRLDSAKICTIHSFCLDILRPNFDRVGLPAKFRTLDDSEVKILRRRVMDDLISDCYDTAWQEIYPSDDLPFDVFADCFSSGRSDEMLLDLFLSLYENVSGYPEGTAFFERAEKLLSESAIKEPFDATSPFGREIKNTVTDGLTHYKDVVSEYLNVFTSAEVAQAYAKPAASDLDLIDTLLAAAESGYSSVRDALQNTAFDRLPSVRAANKIPEFDEYKNLRNGLKDLIQKKLCPMFISSVDGFCSDCRSSAVLCGALGAFLTEFDRRYGAAKRRMGAIDYSDMEHLAYRLLYNESGEKSDVALAVSARFKEIYIDEYQDVNALQDLIFSAASREDNRFMVGDIKQSIYAFRGAMPDIFADYRRQYSSDDNPHGEVIFMSENFRSDSSVINFVNSVFDTVWSRAGDSMDYRTDDRLICGKNGGDTASEKARVVLIDTKSESEDDESPSEAEYVAHEIERLLCSEVKSNGEPIEPRDIAIIVRNSKNFAEEFEKALVYRNIPVQNRERAQFFENPEILLMICLLSAIDNPHSDVFLLGVMMSPLFSFTLDEVVAIRQSTDKKCALIDSVRECTLPSVANKIKKLTDSLEKYRRMSEGAPADRLIWSLYRECGILSLLQKDQNGRVHSARRTNLLTLYEYARAYENGTYRGLYSFINYVNGLISSDAKVVTPSSDTEGENAVKIITAHASKGLEFPVCFVSGCGKKYNDSDTRANILLDRELGAAMKLKIPNHFAKADTCLRRVLANKRIREAREEELRILYVALTRARERLYVTASVRGTDTVLENARLTAKEYSEYSILSMSRYIDVILSALEVSPCDDCVISVCTSASYEPTETAEESVPAADTPEHTAETDKAEVERLTALLRSRLDYEYPYEHLKNLPAKVSVSRLYPDLLDDNGEVFDSESSAPPTLAAAPAFLGGESGFAAEAGTATHVFMQFCDFERLLKDGVLSELDRLLTHGFITDEMAKLIRVDELEKFAESPLIKDICSAEWVRREQRFNLRLSASEFTKNDILKSELEGETLLVQGVIDCFYRSKNGSLVLVDYKTDRLTKKQLEDPAAAREAMRLRHGTQLEYYAEALKEMLGKRPDKILIYSLHLGDTLAM